MTELDKTLGDPTTRLLAYGIPEWRIKLCTELLTIASTSEELDAELGKRHTTIDWSQALMPMFRSIYQNEPDIQSKVQKVMATAGLSVEIINEYFIELGDQPYLAFHLTYDDKIPVKTRSCINALAAQTIVDTVKSYLGLTDPKPQP